MAITVAFCGAGPIAGAHAVAAGALGWRPVAVASRSRTAADRLAVTVRTDVVDVGALPAGADVVVVTTPPERRVDDAIRLLAAGAAVVVEPPLCLTLAEADRLVAASDAHGHRLLYAEHLAHSPTVQAFVGRSRDLGPLDFIEVRTLHARSSRDPLASGEGAGGALFELGVHPLAVALLTAGPDPVATVRAIQLLDDGEGADEHAEVELRFSSGLRALIVASWQAELDPVWDAQASSATGVVRAEFVRVPTLEHNGDPVDLPATRTGLGQIEELGYLGQLASFADDLSRGRPPMMDARFGRRVLEVVMAAHRSAGQGGEPVALPLRGPRDHAPLDQGRNQPP